jgi:hypothetical protein
VCRSILNVQLESFSPKIGLPYSPILYVRAVCLKVIFRDVTHAGLYSGNISQDNKTIYFSSQKGEDDGNSESSGHISTPTGTVRGKSPRYHCPGSKTNPF